MTDWLLPLRRGENEEATYAIRSWVANAGLCDEDRLVIVGDLPPNLMPDVFIPGNTHRSGPVNVYDNILTACRSGLLSEHAVVVNDDMFAVEPCVPSVTYRAPLADHIRALQPNTWWLASMRLTAVRLRQAGIYNGLSYELHRPLPIVVADMARILEDAWTGHGVPPQWRTMYGNLVGIGGEQTRDCKVVGRRGEFAGPWISTTDGAWRLGWADRLMPMFPNPTRWEC